MRLLTLITGIQVVLVTTSIVILGYKYFLLKGYMQSSNRPIRARWVGFYDSAEIYGTSSEIRRGVMQRNNRLSTAFWACIAFILGLAILRTRAGGA